jgi:hypothetical protein
VGFDKPSPLILPFTLDVYRAPQNPNEIGCNSGYSQLFKVKPPVLPSYGELIYAWCLGVDVPYPWTGLKKDCSAEAST